MTNLDRDFLQLLHLSKFLRGDVERLLLRLALLFDDHRHLPSMLG